jgi:rubrerythrin
MALIYNASEIYQMGIEIEKNGMAFYSACARTTKNESAKKLCEELSHWESQHVTVFEDLKAHLPSNAALESARDPDNELPLFLKAAADGHVFIANTDIAALVASAKTPVKMLGLALNFEKDSIVVYTTMSRMVPEHLGKKSLEKIIDEELKHISIITQKMTEFKK